MPVLNAVLWEMLRFYPPAPGSLMRVAPSGSARVADAGCWLPAGTDTSAQVYTLQRNAAVFLQPDEWQPARWLATCCPCCHRHQRRRRRLRLRLRRHAQVMLGRKAGSIADVRDELSIYETDAMRQHMLVFSKGPCSCLGKSIALMELKLATAAIAQRFTTLRLGHARQTVEDMRPVDNAVVTPKGERCDLVFGFSVKKIGSWLHGFRQPPTLPSLCFSIPTIFHSFLCLLLRRRQPVKGDPSF
jgi:cytochrome P450